jgi:hypothetical protein
MSGTTGVKISDATPAAPLQSSDMMPIARVGSEMPYNATMDDITAFVGAAGQGAVSSVNGRTGAVTLTSDDITAAGGALLSDPVFSGNPQAPTQAPGDASHSLATTAFVSQSEAAGGTAGVTSFNGRTGAVSLAEGDVTGVGGALAASVLALSGGTMTGPLDLAADPTATLEAATKGYVDASPFLPLAGGTLSGPLTLAADPTSALQPATKEYVDARMTVSDTAPASPASGALWWDSAGGQLYIWFVDPSGPPGQWVCVVNPPPPATTGSLGATQQEVPELPGAGKFGDGWVQLTQAEYDALSPPDPATLYVIIAA